MQILTVSGLQKTYTTRFGSSKVQALKNVNFTVESGEYVAIMGESGSGKTTLLNILAALDKPTGGTVLLGGKNLSEIPEETAAAFRRDNLGFVFQDFSLLDTFSLNETDQTARALYRYLAQSAPIAPIAFKTASVLTPSGLLDGLNPTVSSPFYGIEGWTGHFDKG